HLRQWRRPLLLSYCATDSISHTDARRAKGWVNDLSCVELKDLAEKAGFTVQRMDRIDRVQWLFRLRSDAVKVPLTRRVAVLSYNNVGNFGDRLGYHLANSILPAHAETTGLNFKPWNASEENFDLLILGIGNSL